MMNIAARICSRLQQWHLPLICLLFAITATGCSTHADRLRSVRTNFYNGDLSQALTSIDEIDKRSDDEVLMLDRAMVELVSGQPQQAELLLTNVRDRFDELEQVAMTEQIASFITDENKVSYAGEDYEKILIRVMLAISSLVGDQRDAMAYAHQIAYEEERLNEDSEIAPEETVEANEVGDANVSNANVFGPNNQPKPTAEKPDNAEQTESKLAISPYVRGILREQTHRDYHEAHRLYSVAASYLPKSQLIQHDLQRLQAGRHSQKGNGVLYVIALVGKGPKKIQVNHAPSTEALFIADQILSATGDRTLPPTIAPVKIATVERSQCGISGIRVATSDGQAVLTETIVDVGAVAETTAEKGFNKMVARAVVRRVVKKGAVYQAKEFANVESQLLDIAFNIGGIAWEATESADTRCWGLLPDKIQIARIELPAGTHRIGLQAISNTPANTMANGLSNGPVHEEIINIRNGANTYALACFPSEQAVGKIVVSR